MTTPDGIASVMAAFTAPPMTDAERIAHQLACSLVRQQDEAKREGSPQLELGGSDE